MPRIGKIFDFLEKEHLDCVVIKDVNTIRYLTGFRGVRAFFMPMTVGLSLSLMADTCIKQGQKPNAAISSNMRKTSGIQLPNWRRMLKQLVLTAIISLIMTSILCRSFYAAKN